jgi:hypothetical protein
MHLSGGVSGPVEIENADRVALGRDGFLFHRLDQVFEPLCGDQRLHADQVERWASLIATPGAANAASPTSSP